MIDLTTHWTGLAVLGIFGAAYFLVICEEAIEMRKSKPVLVAAGLIWALVAIGYQSQGAGEAGPHRHLGALAHVAEEVLLDGDVGTVTVQGPARQAGQARHHLGGAQRTAGQGRPVLLGQGRGGHIHVFIRASRSVAGGWE